MSCGCGLWSVVDLVRVSDSEIVRDVSGTSHYESHTSFIKPVNITLVTKYCWSVQNGQNLVSVTRFGLQNSKRRCVSNLNFINVKIGSP